MNVKRRKPAKQSDPKKFKETLAAEAATRKKKNEEDAAKKTEIAEES